MFFEPLDEGAIGAASRQLAANQVETQGALAHGGFTWENAAEQTIEVIRSAE